MPTDLPTSLQYSPYFAGLEGKNEKQTSDLEDRIDALPAAVKDLLFSESLPDQLKSIADSAQVPEQYAIALAKIVFMEILGDIPVGGVEQLLAKLGLEPEKAKIVSDKLSTLLAPLVVARAQASAPKKLEQLPPMTVKIPPLPENGGAGVSTRNIIDLRKQQPPNA